MEFSFINIHKKSKVDLETDKYLIHRRIKSKLSYSDNYLEIKQLPKTEEELNYYIESARNYFKDKGVNFIHLALPEKLELDKKLLKYLKKENFNKMNFLLYVLDSKYYNNSSKLSNYTISVLDKSDYANYMEFNYKIDLAFANKEWADHNKDSIYENIRSENIVQIIVKDDNKIIATTNIVVNDDFFEIDNLYVDKKYRRQGIASNILDYALKIFGKNYAILLADEDDTPKYLYEKLGFKIVSSKTYFLKSNVED